MPNLLELIDGHLFSGITGNFAYDILKHAWRQITKRSWETLYLDAFQTAVNDARSRLIAYAGADGDIAVDREALVRALHSDVQVGPKLARLSALSDEEFIGLLANAMVERSVLTIGGHALSSEGYAQINRNLIASAIQYFRQAILADEDAFKQALLTETQHNTDQVHEIQRYLMVRFDIVLGHLEQIGANVAEIRQQMPTRAQFDQVLQEVQNTPARIRAELAEDANLRQQLANERERNWNDRFERLRRAVDDGYSAVARDEIVALVDEIERHLADGEAISSALLGSIYRLGAIAFLPSRPGGDVARARRYLRLARQHSNGEGAVKCEIISAVLLDTTQGMEPALDLLADLEGDEPRRLRFALALQHDDIAICEQMIIDGLVDLEQAPVNLLWTRPIMFYYAAAGSRDRLLVCVDALTAVGQPADHIEAAALALTRATFATFARFCRDHQIFPEFHFSLDLETLIDAELRERAITCFERAAEAYLQHRCHADAVRTLVSAIRLLMDQPPDAWRARLLVRLGEIDPGNLLLAAGAVDAGAVDGADALEQLVRAFTDPNADAILLLHRARQVARGAASPRQVADLLISEEAHFHTSPLVQLQFEIGVFELLGEAGDEGAAEAWLARVSSPAPYEHMRLLCHVGFYLPRNIDLTRHWVEQARAIAPNQPEVLLSAALVFGQTGEHVAGLEDAERLFALLRTPQTARLRLDMLSKMGRFRELLNLMEQLADLALSDVERRAYRVTALVALGQPQQALADLEWLVDQNQATIHAMLSLAQIYLRLHRHADAVAILRRCAVKHAHDPNSRMLLSNVLLTQGQRDESFRVAVQAREQFPDDAAVALHLVQLAFPAGHEDAPEVRAALQALTPGGELADAALVRFADIEEARAMLLASMKADQEADRLYSQGQIPLLLRCLLLGVPLCWHHALVREHRAIQLVAPWVDLSPPAWWNTSRLPVIVIDYPALLGLWSLFGNRMLAILRASAERIYLPTSLLDILAWEQAKLATQGQRALEQTRAQMHATLSQRLARVRLHPWPAGDDLTDPISAAVALSTEQQLTYLTAYVPPRRLLDGPTIDLPALADALLRVGEIGPNETRALRQHEPRVIQDAPVLPRGAAIVTNTLTLIAVQQAGALDSLLGYCGQIHLLERDWEGLCSLVGDVAVRERALRDLDQLQALIAQAIQEQFFHTEALPQDGQLFQAPVEGDDEPEDAPLHRLALRYTDEVIRLAYEHQALLWTDDRWTALVGLPEDMVVARVSTDTVLEWLHHHGTLNEEQAYGAHASLISWAYQGHAVNVAYLRWLVRQGIAAEARLLIDTATRYRLSLLSLWTIVQPHSSYGRQYHMAYLRAFAETIVGCFVDRAEPEVAGTIVHNLDITYDWQDLVGHEPEFLSDLLLRLAGLLYPDDSLAQAAVDQLTRFSPWLDTALQKASFAPVAIDEAWRLTIENVLILTDAFVARHGHVFNDALLLKLTLRSMPERAIDRVLAGPLGKRVRDYVGDMLRPEVMWTIQQSDGTVIQLAYPRQQWERDYAQAVDQAVVRADAAPITAGVITLLPVRDRASMWLRFCLLPTARPELHNGAGRPDRIFGLFSRFGDQRRAQRQAVWLIGQQQFAALGLPTRVWEQLRPRLFSNSARAWRNTARQALRLWFGQWPLVRAAIDEAVGLDLRALFDVLTRVEAGDVRAWLGFDTRVDAAALRRWADRAAAGVTLGDDVATVATCLSEYLGRYGHSLFPDALIMRARVTELIMAWPDPHERRVLLQGLVQQASARVSGALKANCVLIALACRSHADWQPDNEADLDVALADLVAALAAPRNPNDPRTAPTRLVGALTAYLYQAWRSNAQGEVTDLAYLAHMAASWVGDALAARLSDEAAEQVHDALVQDTLRANFRPARQPTALFRPSWATLINYGVALLLGVSSELRYALAALLESAPARAALVRCAAQHRILQEMLNLAAVQPAWLDEPRVADIPAATADLFADVDEVAVSTWPEGEQYALIICQVPEAGMLLFNTTIARLSEEADDAEVIRVLGIALLGVEAPGGLGEAVLMELLASERLARIRRSSAAHNFLIWRLTAVLLDTTGYQDDLIAAIRAALRAVPADPAVASDVTATITGTLAHRVAVRQLLDELQDWLIYLGADEEIPLEAVRSALGMLLYWWPELPSSSREVLRPALDELANVPRLQALWELARLRTNE